MQGLAHLAHMRPLSRVEKMNEICQQRPPGPGGQQEPGAEPGLGIQEVEFEV